MSASLEPGPDAVVVLDGELDRRHPAEVRVVERRTRAGRHLGRLARHARDRVDRMAEQVAVVKLRARGRACASLAQLGLDERVDDDRGPALHPFDRELKVSDRLDPWMADLGELLIGELRLERLDEALRGLPGRVRDHVQLDEAHGASVTRRLHTALRNLVHCVPVKRLLVVALLALVLPASAFAWGGRYPRATVSARPSRSTSRTPTPSIRRCRRTGRRSRHARPRPRALVADARSGPARRRPDAFAGRRHSPATTPTRRRSWRRRRISSMPRPRRRS